MTHYILHTEDYGEIYAQYVQTDPESLNNRTRGDTAEFALGIPDENQDSLVVPSGVTHTVPTGETQVFNTADIDGTVVINGTLVIYSPIDNDGTIDNNGTLITRPSEPQGNLLGYDRHAGSYTLSGTLNNTQRYKERLPDTPNVSSLVVGIEPNSNLKDDDIAGKWGLISNVTDSRNRPISNSLITVEIDILADYSEYNNVPAVQNDLEI